jgi:hypothetical protein
MPALYDAIKSNQPLLSTFLGAFTLYVVNRSQKQQPISILSAINVALNRPWKILLDMLLSSLLGSVVIYLLTGPTTVPQGIVAGLGMTGILATHVKDVGAKETSNE